MASSKILYVTSSPAQQNTTSGQWDDIKGLTLTLPPANADAKVALVILDIPNPYAIGTNFPAANFAVKVNGNIVSSMPHACFSYFVQNLPGSSGRMPTTLVVQVKLGRSPIVLQGAWQSIRQSKVIVDTLCSMSAVLGMT